MNKKYKVIKKIKNIRESINGNCPFYQEIFKPAEYSFSKIEILYLRMFGYIKIINNN